MPETMTVEQALELVLGFVKPLPSERVALLDALGRVLAEDATSDIDVAPFDNSAMDGFAVRAADSRVRSEDTPVEFDVVAHIAAGDYWEGEVGPGQAARIMTGAPVPAGADSIVMVEYSASWHRRRRHRLARRALARAQARRAHPPPRRGGARGRRRRPSAGDVLGPAAIGLLASTGHDTVAVYRRPRVGVLSTGSELVEVAEKPGPGKIRNSNSYSIAAQVLAAGGVPHALRHRARTTWTRPAPPSSSLRGECDFILTSGGVSVGDFDFVKPVLEEMGELTFCKVKMRPGNPQTLGTIKGVPFFGLPGNPTSTYVGFEIFVRPALRVMQGFSAIARPVTVARLSHDVKKKQDRRYYLRGLCSACRRWRLRGGALGQPVLGIADSGAPRELLRGAAGR